MNDDLVALQLVQEKFDFFPLNRALSLSAMDEGSTDSKVDDLLRFVTQLVERQREEVSDILVVYSSRHVTADDEVQFMA